MIRIGLAASPLWARRRWLRLFGWPGLAGVCLLAACPVFYFSAIQPAQARLETVREGAASIEGQVRRAASEGHRQLTPAEQLAEFYRVFPNDRGLLPALETVFSLAQELGMNLDQGEYKVARDRVGKLMRFQMILPVRGDYPQIRKYLGGLQAKIPGISLEQLQFERKKIGDPVLEARIRLALYLEQES